MIDFFFLSKVEKIQKIQSAKICEDNIIFQFTAVITVGKQFVLASSDQVLSLPPARSTYYGTNSVHFRGSLIWNNLSSYIKSSRSVCEFENNIKNFRDIDCGYLIC